jgi:hypothetical protein
MTNNAPRFFDRDNAFFAANRAEHPIADGAYAGGWSGYQVNVFAPDGAVLGSLETEIGCRSVTDVPVRVLIEDGAVYFRHEE